MTGIDIPYWIGEVKPPQLYNGREERMTDNQKETPFFARFLEGQEFPQVKTSIKAGAGPTSKQQDQLEQTMKAPSDKDEV